MSGKELENNGKDAILNSNEELLEIHQQFLEAFERLDNFIHKLIAEVFPEKHSGGMASSLYDDAMKNDKKKE